MEKHPFINNGSGKCDFTDLNDGDYCGKKERHPIHRMPKPKMYRPGEIVGSGKHAYQVQANGTFIKVQEE